LWLRRHRYDQQAQAQISGVDVGAGQAIEGYQRGAAQARGRVDQNYRLELGANREIYASQVDAAGQIRSAGLEAAKLRQTAAVIAQVGREISREVGQGNVSSRLEWDLLIRITLCHNPSCLSFRDTVGSYHL
jgi:hypothetical protein